MVCSRASNLTLQCENSFSKHMMNFSVHTKIRAIFSFFLPRVTLPGHSLGFSCCSHTVKIMAGIRSGLVNGAGGVSWLWTAPQRVKKERFSVPVLNAAFVSGSRTSRGHWLQPSQTNTHPVRANWFPFQQIQECLYVLVSVCVFTLKDPSGV